MNTTQEMDPVEMQSVEDHYETLKLSPNVDSETIDRVYKLLVRRYHPDNLETGDAEQFTQVVKAYKVLSDPDARSAYDAGYDGSRVQALAIPGEVSDNAAYESDRKIFQRILAILYSSRRDDAGHGGMGGVHLERIVGCTSKLLEFHLWYLREKGWVERLENGLFAITADGVDEVMEKQQVHRNAKPGHKRFRRGRRRKTGGLSSHHPARHGR